jgi:hypothetical protein
MGINVDLVAPFAQAFDSSVADVGGGKDAEVVV